MKVVAPSYVIGLYLAVVMLAGCAPKLTPLYRDYEHSNGGATSVNETNPSLMRALEAAGWTLVEGPTANVLATAPRTFRKWGLYNVEASLEASSLAGPYVRVFVHPHRRYVWGSKRKIPYLRRSLARSVLGELDEALAGEGLVNVGSAVQRDEAVEKGD